MVVRDGPGAEAATKLLRSGPTPRIRSACVSTEPARRWGWFCVPLEGQLGAATAAGALRKSFSRLWQVQTSDHSAPTAARPRSENCRKPRHSLI